MTHDELLQYHHGLCQKAQGLMARKNKDYAGHTTADPFANFRLSEASGLCSTEAGILVRLSDKLSRLASFLKRGELQVKDESVEDTLLDIINYSVLFGGLLQAEGKEQGRADEPLRIFISGPFTAGAESFADKALHTMKAAQVGLALIKKGHLVYVPHTETLWWEGDLPYEKFLEMDLDKLTRWSTAVFRIEGSSPGADRECEVASEKGLPIYRSLDKVPRASSTPLTPFQWKECA